MKSTPTMEEMRKYLMTDNVLEFFMKNYMQILK
jgi:hypothetical protein